MDATFEPRTNMAYVYLTGVGDPGTVDYTEPLIIDLPGGSRRERQRARTRSTLRVWPGGYGDQHDGSDSGEHDGEGESGGD